MILSTLCYIEKDDKYLMLHRTKKKKDINKRRNRINTKKLPIEMYCDICIYNLGNRVYVCVYFK